MKMRYVTFFAAALLSALTLARPAHADATTPAPAAPNPELVLATVNGEAITAKDLLKMFTERHSGHAAFLGGDSEARSFLNIAIDERLLTQEAYNLRLDEEKSVADVVREFTETTVSNALVKAEIVDRAKPTPEQLEATRQGLTFVMQVRQVAVATRGEAEDIRAAVLQGADIEAIARGCSGARSARNGGNAMVTWGQFAPEWEAIVFALEPGELSPVIETLDGFEVVLVVSKVEVPAPEMKQVSEQLQATLLKRNTAAREKAFGDELWSRHHAQFADVDLSPAALLRAWNAKTDLVLATWDGGGALTLAETFGPGELQQILSLPPQRAKNEIEKRIRATVNSPLTVLEATARKVDEQPEIAARIDEYREYVMKNLLYRDHIFQTIDVKEDALQAFYDAHREQLLEPPKYRVAQIMVATEKEALAIEKKLAGGADFGELAAKESRDPVSASQGGDLGWVTADQVPPAFHEIVTLKPGQVSKPVLAKSGAWHVIKLVEIKDKHLPPLDEIREQVRAKAIEEAKREVRASWIAKLRAASDVVVSDKGIEQFVADHASDGNQPPPQHALQ